MVCAIKKTPIQERRLCEHGVPTNPSSSKRRGAVEWKPDSTAGAYVPTGLLLLREVAEKSGLLKAFAGAMGESAWRAVGCRR
jgi:hypothetical protein